MANGDICLAVANSGDGVQAMERAEEAHNGVHLEYVVPKEGSKVWFDVLAIPADAQHKVQAHAFINILLDPKHIAKVTQFTGYANPTPDSKQFLPPAILTNEGIYPSAAVTQGLYVSGQPESQYVRYVHAPGSH